MRAPDKYFYLSQRQWIEDDSPLKLLVKARQTGFSFCNACRLVLLVSARDARLDAYISSRDQYQANLQLEDCCHWAQLLNRGATHLGEVLLDPASSASAFAVQFANGRRIYSLSSNPNALAGKRGHVTLDEFALHQDQRLLYRVAKPVTTWGGQLSIISTHRGVNTLFNQLIRDITENGNPMGWSFHSVPIQKAVAEGIVERINKKTGRHESREAFLQRLRAECIDEEQWLQEYCCVPADEHSAFISYEMLNACEDSALCLPTLQDFLASASPRPRDDTDDSAFRAPHVPASSTPHSALRTPHFPAPHSSLYLGLDVARKNDLCVLDLGEKIDGITYDRLRLELRNQTFSDIKNQLYPLLRLPRLKRACIDATGLGIQLAEEAKAQFGWKVQPVTFTAALKEQLAFALRSEFEDRKLRIVRDDTLRADLRGIRKEVTSGGHIALVGDTADSHCDRFWAKALRQHAARYQPKVWAMVA